VQVHYGGYQLPTISLNKDVISVAFNCKSKKTIMRNHFNNSI